MQESQEKILQLEQSVTRVSEDVRELKKDLKQVQTDLWTWFDRLDVSVQDLNLAQAKFEEQSKARDFQEKTIAEQLGELKGFQYKLFFAVVGGGISVILWLVQSLFAQAK